MIKKFIIAHRGASFYRPENTLAAFELAYQQGADGIETDIHLSKDGIPMLIHDAQINRVTHATGLVNQLTCQELKEYDIGSWFNSKYHTERMVTLAEFLHWAHGKNLLLNLELKTGDMDDSSIEKIVYQEVDKYKMLNQVIFSSFNSQTLERLKKIDPNTKVAILASRHQLTLLQTSQQLQFNGVHLKHNYIDRVIIRKYHREGKYVGVYTVNNPNQMRRCFQANCDMIITDRPDLAIEKRQLYLDCLK
ncbi:glycerophosphodiester phosphodiesterase [Amphibacillus sp. Q70]|uniref:glycerophosphodiester phosphodiesterase n=1 Tax=Amphibacillus sp. Q70 TaxID=3453416 RepID=UPI003F879D25